MFVKQFKNFNTPSNCYRRLLRSSAQIGTDGHWQLLAFPHCGRCAPIVWWVTVDVCPKGPTNSQSSCGRMHVKRDWDRSITKAALFTDRCSPHQELAWMGNAVKWHADVPWWDEVWQTSANTQDAWQRFVEYIAGKRVSCQDRNQEELGLFKAMSCPQHIPMQISIIHLPHFYSNAMPLTRIGGKDVPPVIAKSRWCSHPWRDQRSIYKRSINDDFFQWPTFRKRLGLRVKTYHQCSASVI